MILCKYINNYNYIEIFIPLKKFYLLKKPSKTKKYLPTVFYEGGHTKLDEFISKNLNYPEEALQLKIEGIVLVKYEIDYKGNVIKTKVMSGIGHGCDEEAERLVSLLKFSVDQLTDMKVKFTKSIHIHFKLPPAPQTNIQLNYSITNTNSTTQANQKTSSYQYTIVFDK